MERKKHCGKWRIWHADLPIMGRGSFERHKVIELRAMLICNFYVCHLALTIIVLKYCLTHPQPSKPGQYPTSPNSSCLPIAGVLSADRWAGHWDTRHHFCLHTSWYLKSISACRAGEDPPRGALSSVINTSGMIGLLYKLGNVEEPLNRRQSRIMYKNHPFTRRQHWQTCPSSCAVMPRISS